MKPPDWAARLPWSILILSVALISIGVLGIARSETLAGGTGRLFWQQIIWAPLAILAMLAMTLPSYRILCRFSYLLLGVSLLLLITVYFFPAINGSHRWIRLGPIGLQPSELTKVAFVMALARWLMHRSNYRRLRGLLAPLVLTMLPVALILREPDLGTALVFLPVLFAMLFAAGARPRHLATIAVVGVLILPLLWIQMSREQKSRVTAVLAPAAADVKPDDDQYHLFRAKQTLTAGGPRGTFLSGESDIDPGLYLVPAAATDSILCVLGERYGLWGIGLVLFLYSLLIYRCLAIARRTKEPFGRLLTVGIAALLAVQVIINTAMTVGWLPITGLSLPLLSYGGSGLLAHALALGLVLNVGMRPGYEVAGEPFRFAETSQAA